MNTPCTNKLVILQYQKIAYGAINTVLCSFPFQVLK